MPEAIFRTQDVTKVYDTGSTQVQVLAGLELGQSVITHPSDAIADGVAITEREAQYPPQPSPDSDDLDGDMQSAAHDGSTVPFVICAPTQS
ncbi:MAG: hypothetical protein R8G60_13850 [Roseovarius pacificus]|nr:hypothetical protein [Roseovarius pacificus]